MPCCTAGSLDPVVGQRFVPDNVNSTEGIMSTNAVSIADGKKRSLSIDTWAVVLSLLAALLIRAGMLNRIPW